MAYKLFDRDGNEVKQGDLQDKGPWCISGASYERVFVEKYGSKLGLIINPEKEFNIYAADLFNPESKNVGDLKTQNTPFFQAATMYNINPEYAVTFNEKDFVRYSNLYPNIEIYFWVVWLVTKFENNGQTIEVAPIEGVWKITFDNIKKLVKTSRLHSYQQRANDNKGNAKGSFVFNLTDPLFEKLL